MDAVVMLNYNCSNLIIKAIESFKSFKKRIELFIVDNNSNISNKTILEEYEKNKDDFVHIFYNKENLGFAKGNNVALKKIEDYIKCDNVFILNPDVYINENIVETIDDFISKTVDCGAVSIEHPTLPLNLIYNRNFLGNLYILYIIAFFYCHNLCFVI